MQSDDIAKLIQDDFEETLTRYENDAFADRVLFKLESKRRARLGVIALSGGLGAAFAASQFSEYLQLVTAELSDAASQTPASAAPFELVALIILAGAMASVVAIMRQDV